MAMQPELAARPDEQRAGLARHGAPGRAWAKGQAPPTVGPVAARSPSTRPCPLGCGRARHGKLGVLDRLARHEKGPTTRHEARTGTARPSPCRAGPTSCQPGQYFPARASSLPDHGVLLVNVECNGVIDAAQKRLPLHEIALRLSS
ncbi:hypothetical protein HU200_019911 [Digitaria exilis]|uniref:Uncharacterized protein n=1 Tax=Digitaria exilis TaxID=1010633 RepID=A0A835F157_9POAL|nr:hypothetical protein HU200_019911 [Digitaria exilis]